MLSVYVFNISVVMRVRSLNFKSQYDYAKAIELQIILCVTV